MITESEIAAFLCANDSPSETVRVTLSIDGYLLSRIDKIAQHAETSRSRVFTMLLENGIQSIENSIRYFTVPGTEPAGDSNV